MAAFPSKDWFDQVRAVFNSDDSFQGGGGGACNALVGVKVEGESFLITFEGAECSDAQNVREGDLAAADFVLETAVLGLEGDDPEHRRRTAAPTSTTR